MAMPQSIEAVRHLYASNAHRLAKGLRAGSVRINCYQARILLCLSAATR